MRRNKKVMSEKTSNLNEGIGEEKKKSLWTHISYLLMGQPLSIFWGMFSSYYFFFYDAEVHLGTGLIALAFSVFTVWDAFNDVIIGHLSDNPTRFTKKWGRRFPWIIGGILPVTISFVLIWIPPQGASQVGLFFWFVIVTMVFELGYTMISTTRGALFPEKFRTEKERIRNSAIYYFLDLIGMAIGALIPPMIIEVGVTSSYFVASLIVVIPSVLFFVLGISGNREDPEAIARTIKTLTNEAHGRTSLKKSLKNVLLNKNFLAFSIATLIYTLGYSLFSTSLLYYIIYIVRTDESILGVIQFVPYVVGLLSVPLWLYIIKKKSKKFAVLLGALLGIPLFLMYSFGGINNTFMIIIGALYGISSIGLLLPIDAILGDIIDEIVVKSKQRNTGVYNGIHIFLSRLGYLFPPIIIAAVYHMVNFDASMDIADIQPSSLMGIMANISWIPAGFCLLAAIVFGFFYDIDNDKSEKLKLQLHELNI